MYRAYDRHLYERFTDTPATPKIVPLAGDHPRVDRSVAVSRTLERPAARGRKNELVSRFPMSSATACCAASLWIRAARPTKPTPKSM
jgi:hypothetical protein